MFRFVFVVVACLAGSVHAETSTASNQKIDRIAAALTLAQVGQDTENAQLIVAGLEMLHAQEFDATFAPTVIESLFEEARFLVRGNQALMTRLDLLSALQPSGSDIRLWLLEPQQNLRLPSGIGVSAFLAFSGSNPSESLGIALTGCSRTARVWQCDLTNPVPAYGFSLTGKAGPWAIVETKPLQE